MKTAIKPKPHPLHKLRPKDRAYILRQKGKKSQTALAQELGVGRSTVADVIHGRTWKPPVTPGVTAQVTPEVTAK